MSLRDVMIMAANTAADTGKRSELMEIFTLCDQWNELLDTPLEDLHLSRLDLDEMQKDYCSIPGVAL